MMGFLVVVAALGVCALVGRLLNRMDSPRAECDPAFDLLIGTMAVGSIGVLLCAVAALSLVVDCILKGGLACR